MANNILINTSPVGSYRTKNITNDLNNAKRQLDRLNQYGALAGATYYGPNGAASLFPLDYADRAANAGIKLAAILYKLEQYMQLLNATPEEFADIDDSYKDQLSNWRERNYYMAGVFLDDLRRETLIDEFWKEFGWTGVLSGTGWISDIYKLISKLRKADSWSAVADAGYELSEFLEGAEKTYRNYTRIGRAVGTKKSTWWLFRKVTGLKDVGRVSTAKKVTTRFFNNLTNKTSPFNLGKAVKESLPTWDVGLITGVTNFFGNIQEQKEANGEMSTGRVLAETVTETAVDLALDTVITTGINVVVGAAVSAVIGPVAAPTLLITAVGVAATTALNVKVEAVTGKTATEWVSDGILDFGESLLGI